MEEKTALQAIEDIRHAAAKAVAHVGAANYRERQDEAKRWIEDAYVKAVLSVTPPVAPATDAEGHVPTASEPVKDAKPAKKPVTPWTFETIPELTMRVCTIRSGNPKVACARPNCVVGYDDRGIAFNVSYPQFAERYVRMDGSPCGV